MMKVGVFARQILDMEAELDWLRSEVYRLQIVESQYKTFVDDSLRSGQEGMANWLRFLTDKRVTIAESSDSESN